MCVQSSTAVRVFAFLSIPPPRRAHTRTWTAERLLVVCFTCAWISHHVVVFILTYSSAGSSCCSLHIIECVSPVQYGIACFRISKYSAATASTHPYMYTADYICRVNMCLLSRTQTQQTSGTCLHDGSVLRSAMTAVHRSGCGWAVGAGQPHAS